MLGFGRRSAAALLGAVAALACSASMASAGSYHVYSCRTPSGAPAPADGWVGTEVGAASVTADSCAGGGSLAAVLREESGRVANSDSATWRFTPPANAQLVSGTLMWAGDADGGEAAVPATASTVDTRRMFNASGNEIKRHFVVVRLKT